MKAIVVQKDGQLGVGPWEDLSRTQGRGEMVQVRYAGVGFADVMAAKGGYLLAPPAPFSPGYEFMGTVERAGVRVRVAGLLTSMNGYRDQLSVDPRLVVPLPDGVSDETAAALPLNYLTALALLDRLGQLNPGQSVLVHGAAGGVGIAVLELCRLMGLRAFGSCGAPKHELVKKLGGTPILRGELEDSPGSIYRRFGGFDAVLDPFGGASLERSWKLLRPKGVLVCYWFASTIQGGTRAVLQGVANLLVKKINRSGKRTRLCGTPGIVKKDPGWYAESMERILGWAQEKKINPVIHRIYPWTKVQEAHSEIEAGRVQGKILLDFTRDR